MIIVPFPTHRVGDIDPEPPASAKRPPRAVRGIELQAAREAAGFTHETLARRMILIWPNRMCGGLSQRDERYHVPRKARELAFMERVSQDAYERTAAWYATPLEQRPEQGRPRIHLPEYDEALAAIALGHADATLDELRDAMDALDRERRAAGAAKRREQFERRGAEIANLVWNHADDLAFLDQALAEELRYTFPGDENYLVRVILIELAHELRLTFPSRPSLDVDRREAA